MSLSYEDRGILKWNGFYLSDHTEQLAKEKKKQIKNPQKMQMDFDEIGTILAEAERNHQQVTLQKEEVDLEGNYPDDVVGFVNGFDELGIYIGSEKIHYDEIRNVQISIDSKWNDLKEKS